MRATVVELESFHAEPLWARQPVSLAEARKLDLETAVLMQVCKLKNSLSNFTRVISSLHWVWCNRLSILHWYIKINGGI